MKLMQYFRSACAFAALTVLLSSCSNQSRDYLAYTFRLNEASNAIEVQVVYTPLSQADTVQLLLPSSFDRFQMKNTMTVKDFELVSKGKVIKTSEDHYQVLPESHSIEFRYLIPSISDDSLQISCTGDEFFIPAINTKFFHFYGDKGLVTPVFEDSDRLFDVETYWENIPETWHIANDFGISEVIENGFGISKVSEGARVGQRKERVLLNNIGNTLFFGGEYRKTAILIDDKQLNIYLYGKWKFKDELIISAIEEIARVEFEMWDHFYHSNNYVISLTQKGTDDCGKMTGRNMLDSFSYYLPGKFTEEYLPLFYPSLVHEFTHSWIGMDVIGNHPEPSRVKWFTEGFTDYYTARISLETGFFDQQDYVDKLNELIQNYLLSPFATTDMEGYVGGYLYDERLENLAYHKGAVFAFFLDGYIRQQTDHKSNIDDLVKTIYEQSSMERMNHHLTNDFVIETVKNTLGLDVSDLFKRYLIDGELIPVESPLIEEQTTLKRATFDYGFDYVKSIQTEIISSVRENSNAYRAGLRTGQKFLGINKMTTEPNGEMILVVSDENGQKTVEYRPSGVEISIPVIKRLTSAK